MWAFALLLRRIEDARDRLSTYAQASGLAVHGRELLAEHVPPSLVMASYPRGVDDDWCELADLAYEAARARWLSGGDDSQVLAAALQSHRRAA